LHGIVCSPDVARGRRVAQQIHAGRVVIDGMTNDPQVPWGGFKFSGFGREYCAYGISAFVEPRTIIGVA
jgi:aldehyde dehydrogenase (NAD+)